jgi:hypothetical protein
MSLMPEPANIEWATQKVIGVEQRVCALTESAMQQAMLNSFVETLSPKELVTVLYVLQDRANNGLRAARLALQAMALDPGVLVLLPYDVLKQSYQLAHDWGWPQVAGLFLSEPLRGPPNIDEAFTGNEHYDLPLGVRRQAARSSDRLVLDRLLHDRNHRVIALLLNNPNVVERDVIAVAARRPTRPEVLETVARNRKWSARYRVRKSLVFNPYTPNTISRQLISTLMSNDLRALVNAGAIPQKLRELAQTQLSVRPASAALSRYHDIDVDISDADLEAELNDLNERFPLPSSDSS